MVIDAREKKIKVVRQNLYKALNVKSSRELVSLYSSYKIGIYRKKDIILKPTSYTEIMSRRIPNWDVKTNKFIEIYSKGSYGNDISKPFLPLETYLYNIASNLQEVKDYVIKNKNKIPYMK